MHWNAAEVSVWGRFVYSLSTSIYLFYDVGLLLGGLTEVSIS